MTPEVLSCPYCNARFAVPAAEVDNPRIRCPRCGDSFPHHAAHDPATVNGTPLPPPPGPAASPPTARPSNKAVLRVILAVMAGMALVALVFALYTQDFRRRLDRKNGPGIDVPLAKSGPHATPPAELAGLGYLPADTALVAGLHLAEMLHDAEGKKLWDKLRSGPAEPVLVLIEGKTGLHAEEIDHLVLGVCPDAGPPRVFLVLRSRRPYSPEALARALTPARPESFRGKPVYHFPLGDFGSGLVFRAADDTLILSLGLLPAQLRDLEAIPAKPRKGADGLPATVRDLLKDKLERGSLVWAVGALDELPSLVDFARFAGAAEAGKLLANLKAFSAGIRFQDGVTLGVAFQGKDDKAAQELAAHLKEQTPKGVESFRVVGPDQGWVNVQVRATIETVVNLTARLVPVEARP